MSGFTDRNVTGQSGKCVLITGANTGIGFELSRVLAARGARVLLACRDENKARDAIDRIRHLTPNADLAFIPLDLADLHSVRNAAAQANTEPRIDVLINNAGIMYTPLQRTRQGFELQFGVNHLGAFALTALLIPKLAETGTSRVVVTSSITHRDGNLKWDDLNAEKSYSRTQRYSDSKLANALFFLELDRRLLAARLPVTAMGCHPGAAKTELARNAGPLSIPLFLMRPLMNSAAAGAWPALQAATDLAEPGSYFGPTGLGGLRGPSAKSELAACATDIASARKLWDVSIEMTGVDPGLPPAL